MIFSHKRINPVWGKGELDMAIRQELVQTRENPYVHGRYVRKTDCPYIRKRRISRDMRRINILSARGIARGAHIESGVHAFDNDIEFKLNDIRRFLNESDTKEHRMFFRRISLTKQ